jgi:hypothetical protein
MKRIILLIILMLSTSSNAQITVQEPENPELDFFKGARGIVFSEYFPHGFFTDNKEHISFGNVWENCEKIAKKYRILIYHPSDLTISRTNDNSLPLSLIEVKLRYRYETKNDVVAYVVQIQACDMGSTMCTRLYKSVVIYDEMKLGIINKNEVQKIKSDAEELVKVFCEKFSKANR